MNSIEHTLKSYKYTKKQIKTRLCEIRNTKPFDWKMCALYERELLEVSTIISELEEYLKVVNK